MIGERLWWLERIGISVEIVVQNVYRIRENEIHNWWLWTRKMYWDLGLLPGMPQKWKVSPLRKAAFVQKAGFTLLFWSACFWWYLRQISRRRIFLLFQYVYSTDFCRDWICKLIAFSLCSISKWYQMLHRQHFVKYFYFTPIMLFSISCIQFTNKPQYLVSIPIVQ